MIDGIGVVITCNFNIYSYSSWRFELLFVKVNFNACL